MKPFGKNAVGEQEIKTQDVTKVEEKIDFSKVQIEELFEADLDFETFLKSDFRVVKVLNCEEVPKSKNY